MSFHGFGVSGFWVYGLLAVPIELAILGSAYECLGVLSRTTSCYSTCATAHVAKPVNPEAMRLKSFRYIVGKTPVPPKRAYPSQYHKAFNPEPEAPDAWKASCYATSGATPTGRMRVFLIIIILWVSEDDPGIAYKGMLPYTQGCIRFG